MGRPLDIYDRIAVATIIVYSFFFCGGIFLTFKHGFAKSSGWRFLVILALARLIGSSLRLATISDPTNENLYVGWMVLNGLGLGPLITMLLGLLARLFMTISFNRNGNFFYSPRFQHLWELAMLVGLILVIVGGTESDFTIVNNEPKVHYSELSEAGISIFVAITGILCFGIFVASYNYASIDQGERRILVALILCMPFVIVRLVFACLEIWGGITASRWLYLGMFVIMEMIVVFICQVLGFLLDKVKIRPAPGEPDVGASQGQHWSFMNIRNIRGPWRDNVSPRKA